MLFQSQSCNQGHALNREDPKIGPDLSRLVDRGFTPASFVRFPLAPDKELVPLCSRELVAPLLHLSNDGTPHSGDRHWCRAVHAVLGADEAWTTPRLARP